jgi:hypothetical protein
MICLQDQAKTNTNGRVDEHGAFRHKHVELCSVGAMGFLLWARFQVLDRARPDFAPDYGEGSGTFGTRVWYDWFVFPSNDGDDIEMSYQSGFSFPFLFHEQS